MYDWTVPCLEVKYDHDKFCKDYLNLCWRLHKRVECISFWLGAFMGPCDTIIDSLCLSPNSFFLYTVELTKVLFVGNTLFLLSTWNEATFSHAPTAFVSVCLYILWLSFLLYPAGFKFYLILLVLLNLSLLRFLYLLLK